MPSPIPGLSLVFSPQATLHAPNKLRRPPAGGRRSAIRREAPLARKKEKGPAGQGAGPSSTRVLQSPAGGRRKEKRKQRHEAEWRGER
eukprot:3001147-Alexandrium_andersonii.AAC.1